MYFSYFLLDYVGVTYLDHAGATLYAKSQVEAHTIGLTANLYGNPHSQSPSSQASTAAVDHVRDLVLRFFGTDSDHYDVVFTSGCTAALKLLSECFPWRALPPPQPPNNSLSKEVPLPYVGSGVDTDFSQSAPLSRAESEDAAKPIPTAEFKDDIPLSKAGSVADNSEVNRATSEGSNADSVSGGSKMRTSVSVFYTRDLKVAGVDVCGARRVGEGSVFCYLEDNHTSVIGMREVAAQFGASVVCTTAQDIVGQSQLENTAESGTTHSEYGAIYSEFGSTLSESGTVHFATGATHPEFGPTLSESRTERSESGTTQSETGPEDIITPPHPTNTGSNSQRECLSDCDKIFNLLVYPAQSNFCGRKYPLGWCTEIPSGQMTIAGLFPRFQPSSWKICLDAASLVATNPLDLTQHPADFVTVSFYKVNIR